MERRDVPYSLPMDDSYKRMQYVRYADDFLIGVIGSKKDCEIIKKDIAEFLCQKLGLELSQEKTLITRTEKSPFSWVQYLCQKIKSAEKR